MYETIEKEKQRAPTIDQTNEDSLRLASLHNPDMLETYKNIEKIIRAHKVHRNILDQEVSILNSL